MMMVGTYTDLYDSPLTPWTTLGPLSFVLAVSMFKEGMEDIKRHKSDAKINSTLVSILDVASSTPENIVYVKKKVRTTDTSVRTYVRTHGALITPRSFFAPRFDRGCRSGRTSRSGTLSR